MNVLLVGGAGFIGSNLTERLLNDGLHTVTVIDVAAEKIRQFENHPNLRYIRLDIASAEDGDRVEDEVQEADVVVNLAASRGGALEALAVDYGASSRLAQLCLSHGKWVVQFSSSDVYGMSAASAAGLDDGEDESSRLGSAPFVEDESPLVLGPTHEAQWAPACACQMLERALHAHGRRDGLKYTIVRLFDVLGPRLDYLPSEKGGHEDGADRPPVAFVCEVIDALLHGAGPVRLVDGGEWRRTFVDVDDAVDCVAKIVEGRGRGTLGRTFNVGHPGNEIGMRELAERVCEIFEQNFRRDGDPPAPEFVSVSSREVWAKGYLDSDRRLPDIGKARDVLGWEPHHDLDWMLFRTLEYFVQRHRDKQACEE
ncbi:unnamed protein product [Ostreobium quekettii]|uniref:NAD-dependent epimerase/dehydratase domain-containing protein n=1 Tax=Ostreobium quekettii TaxID=121088 RepID=A0A8S1ITQ9_9CHLO|nr:unnamed protein product [Ostreobium quekettii]|eukprot:evm.model.scf_181EXC.8 EVM.evm.TU.scf_181EXC.8   scf_181EXC:42074-43180(+)